MSTYIYSFNYQNSVNPFEPLQESNQHLQKNNQNSLSYLGINFFLQKQQQSRSLSNIQAIIDNLLGRNEQFINKQDILNLQILNGFSDQSNLIDFPPERESQIQQSSEKMVELENKKGLKNLAKLLISTLKKKRFDSSKYLTEQIQQKLMKGKKISKNEQARQSKNIRRRTYDALNVMMAANVLGPDLAFIRRVNSGSFTKKCAFIIGQKNEVQAKISHLNQKINKKMEFLEQLKKKKLALKWWMNQKEKQSFNNPIQQHSQNQITDKNVRNQKTQLQNGKIALPVIVIAESQQNGSAQIDTNIEGILKVNYKYQKIKLFSDIDCFQMLKCQSEIEKETNIIPQSQSNGILIMNKKFKQEKHEKKQEYLVKQSLETQK